MIEQVGQGRMLVTVEQATGFLRRSVGLVVFVAVPALGARSVSVQSAVDARQREHTEQSQRLEGDAVLALADAAMAGRSVPSDFDVEWQNDFIKAQRGTFVPFTLTLDATRLSRPAALVYIRAVRRTTRDNAHADTGRKPNDRDRSNDPSADAQYPVDAIFPVELRETTGRFKRISRGFSLLPGEYDVVVVVRERVDADAPRVQPKAAVLRREISVPDFWLNELTTSTIIVADRLNTLTTPVPPDQLAERPYVIGRSDITPAADRRFSKTEELIVVFLVYNPLVTADRQFDVQVEYHFFRKVEPGDGSTEAGSTPQPGERTGEKYYNHTDPQRFNPALMGTGFDPSGGQPVMAGQVIPLGGFREGDYRLAVKVTDLLSGRSVSRDVQFTVGS
jgi:hypothetical protein